MSWLIVGLGNPGPQYALTRHNLGFMLIDRLAEAGGARIRREECRSLVGQMLFDNEPVELVKAQTFMNLSGEAVSCLLRKEGRAKDRLIVISDDLALPFGKLRLRPGGSAGGHNGLKSIAACLGTTDYNRLRIGIQPDHPVNDTSGFVLDKFSRRELEQLREILEQGAEAISTVIKLGIGSAMAKFN
jgi:peptidyl-tRNA hydrolase, PTH1 family